MHRAALSLLMLAMACADDSGVDPTTSGGSTGSSGDTTSTSMTDPTSDTGSSATTLDDSSSGGSSDTSTSSSSSDDSSSGTTVDPPVELEVTLSDPIAFMDCMPEVAPDPLNVSVTMFFDNPGDGIGTADVTEARLSSGGVEAVSFDLTPASFGPFDPNDLTNGDATKVDGSATPQNGCDTVECGGDYDLEIVFDVDGTEVFATTMVTVECAF